MTKGCRWWRNPRFPELGVVGWRAKMIDALAHAVELVRYSDAQALDVAQIPGPAWRLTLKVSASAV